MARKVSGQDTPRVALSQIEDLMRGSTGRADAVRADALQTLVSVKRAKLVQTRRERARLAVRYGEDSPQVGRIDRQMAAEHRFLVNTRAEADRTSVPTLERDDNAWKVHGFVRNADGLGRRGVTVALVRDAKGGDGLVETTTDKRGYFLIEVGRDTPAIRDEAGTVKARTAAAATAKPTTAKSTAAKAAAAKPTTDKATAAEAAATDETLASDRYVRRLAASLERNVYLATTSPGTGEQVVDPRPLNPVAGGIAYRDITVSDDSDDGTVCQLRTQFLGNSSTREVHDLSREQPACNIARMRPDHRLYFQSISQARELGYDFCARCFGPEMSER